MDQVTRSSATRSADRLPKEAFLDLDVLSESEHLVLLRLMRRGHQHFSEWSAEIQALWRKKIVFPIDDNHEVFAVRDNIWAARDQFLNANEGAL